jgi:hypothetical protein
MLRKSAFLLTTALAELAFPIGRIGNNLRMGDAAEHYSSAIPVAFRNVSTVNDGGLILTSGRFGSSPMVPADLQVLPFRTQYPDLVGAGVQSIQEYFFKSPGIRYEKVAVSNSALSLFGETPTSYIGVSVCGDGRGFVMFGPRLDLTKKGILEILLQTEFEEPCRK